MRWDHRFAALVVHVGDKLCSGVAAIRDDPLECEPVEEYLRLRAVMALSCGQEGSQRITSAINGEVNLATEAAATPPERLLAVFFVRLRHRDGHAQSWRQSSHARCRGALASAANNRSQTLASHQRTNRLYTLFQSPYSAGSKRHCAPLRLIHFTASMKRRQECSSRPS